MTVYARRVASTPSRTPSETWNAICELLGATDGALAEAFVKVAGIMSSVIADQYPAKDPIVVVGNGPRVRVYCIYGESALGDEASESPVHDDLLGDDWTVFVPVGPKDMTWVYRALEAHPGFRVYDPKKGLARPSGHQGATVMEMEPDQEAWGRL